MYEFRGDTVKMITEAMMHELRSSLSNGQEHA